MDSQPLAFGEMRSQLRRNIIIEQKNIIIQEHTTRRNTEILQMRPTPASSNLSLQCKHKNRVQEMENTYR